MGRKTKAMLDLGDENKAVGVICNITEVWKQQINWNYLTKSGVLDQNFILMLEIKGEILFSEWFLQIAQ